jgi:hypothetical protein
MTYSTSFNECAECGHYSGEAEAMKGPCFVDEQVKYVSPYRSACAKFCSLEEFRERLINENVDGCGVDRVVQG